MDLRAAAVIFVLISCTRTLVRATPQVDEEITTNIRKTLVSTLEDGLLIQDSATSATLLQLSAEEKTKFTDINDSEKTQLLEQTKKNDLEPLKLEENYRDAEFVEAFDDPENTESASKDSTKSNKEYGKSKKRNDEDNRQNFRRQGDVRPLFNHRRFNPTYQQNVDFDDSRSNSQPNRYPPPPPSQASILSQQENTQSSETSSESREEQQKDTDKERSNEQPLFRLTMGGYQRPFQNQVTAVRNAPRTQNAPQNAPQQNGEARSHPRDRRILPQVSYTSRPSGFTPQQQNMEPIVRTPMAAPVTSYNAVPEAYPRYPEIMQNNFPVQSPMSNPLQDYNNALLARLQNNQINGYSPFGSELNGGLYQAAQVAGNNFPGLPSPLVGPAGFQPNAYPNFEGFQSVEDITRPEFNAYGGPANLVNSPFGGPGSPLNSPLFYPRDQPFGGGLRSPSSNIFPNYPNALPPQFSQYPGYPIDLNSMAPNGNTKTKEDKEKETRAQDVEQERESESVSQEQNNGHLRSVPLKPSNDDNIYINYPTRQSGYATEERLPGQNASGGRDEPSLGRNPRIQFPGPRQINSPVLRQQPLMLGGRIPFMEPVSRNINPYQRFPSQNLRNNDDNVTYEQFFQNLPPQFNYPQIGLQQVPPNIQNGIYHGYPERTQPIPGVFQSPSFYAGNNILRPIDSVNDIPENGYTFYNPRGSTTGVNDDEDRIPTCAKKNNASVCFEDADYPRNEILYSLDSDAILMERLVTPPSVQGSEQRSNSEDQSDDGSDICNVDVKQGQPMRAKNVQGKWKVLVNLGNPRFSQSIRLEVCSNAGQACSYTDNRVKTQCLQKYSFHRLLSWNLEKGIHMDLFKLPVACSCQLIQSPNE